jgi:hypothetical protein
MTETTKKDSIIASLILGMGREGVTRESEEQLVEPAEPDPPEQSLFSNVPIDGDSGDDGVGGDLPFAVAHGEPQISEAVRRDDSGRELETSEIGGDSFVGTTTGSRVDSYHCSAVTQSLFMRLLMPLLKKVTSLKSYFSTAWCTIKTKKYIALRRLETEFTPVNQTVKVATNKTRKFTTKQVPFPRGCSRLVAGTMF